MTNLFRITEVTHIPSLYRSLIGIGKIFSQENILSLQLNKLIYLETTNNMEPIKSNIEIVQEIHEYTKFISIRTTNFFIKFSRLDYNPKYDIINKFEFI